MEKPSIGYPYGYADRAKADWQLGRQQPKQNCIYGLRDSTCRNWGYQWRPSEEPSCDKKQMAMHVCFFINICTVYWSCDTWKRTTTLSNIWRNNLSGDELICCQKWTMTSGKSTSQWVSPISWCTLRSYIILQQYLESKNFFTRPFPLYDSIANLLGDSCASGSVLLNVWQSPEPLAIIPSFAINPELEEMLHQSTREDKGEGSIYIHLHLCSDLTKGSNLP